ncbi:hypothetical protein JL475_00310 [Streptomyces sp. M2CJ-2]|uniref:hypothetical protein n=1 Tax=Streptomyces sp. M2CJ-2 TaxID=2803948 RepID=UPI001923C374|nr:hypothetical protein [Streptomyces sp. M2CJ-2]MBL3664488.1 hypothetical protein [Streptomyces sp. M2CJ-2]
MDLTARYVQDSRDVIAEVGAADITNPDMPHQTAVKLLVRLTETLRSMSDHAERLETSASNLRSRNSALDNENSSLRQTVAALEGRRRTATVDGTSTPAFQIITATGETYTGGDKREFAFLDRTETLADYDHDGDYLALEYSGGIVDWIPEAQILHVIDSRPEAA